MENPFLAATLTLLTLLFMASLLRPVANRSNIPFSVLLVIAGMGLGLLSDYWETPWITLTDTTVFGELIMVILLPTLVFETATSIDTRQLMENHKAILYLAVPGLLLSAGVITLIVGVLTELPWSIALLLGVILSATDPVAVIEEFRRLGTPKDLTLLVEGESLFNDATTIVLAKIIVVALGTGVALQHMVWDGTLHFLLALLGGIANGWLFSRITYSLLIRLRDDPYIEIALTLLLAYGSYLCAEYLLHASGIISSAVAGLVLAGERPLPISHRVEQYLNSFWHFLSFMATTLIFLMVGLIVKPEFLLQGIDIAIIVIIAMLVSRSAIIYGLMPWAEQLRRHPRKVCMAYRHILNWGGLRGAVTLALAMGLSTLTGAEQLLSVTLVAVLFTIIVQGLSIGRLTHYLKLDIPDTSDRIAHTESWLSAKNSAKQQLEELKQTPFGRTGAPDMYEHTLEQEIAVLQKQLAHWHSEEEGPIGEWRRLMIRGLSLEISYIYRLFDQGLLPSRSYIHLQRNLNAQMEALRHNYPQPEFMLLKRLPAFWTRILSLLPISRSPDEFVAEDYLTAWARRLSSRYAVERVESLMELDSTEAVVRDYVQKIYSGWHDSAIKQIHTIEELFPQIATEQQQLLVQRLSLTAQRQDIEKQTKTGLLTEGEAEAMILELSEQLDRCVTSR